MSAQCFHKLGSYSRVHGSESLKNISSACLSADLSQVWPEANQHFSKEIDDEANSYFQRIYNHPPHPTMSVDEVSTAATLILTQTITYL